MNLSQIENGITKAEQYAAMLLSFLHMFMPNSTVEAKATQALQLAHALVAAVEASPLVKPQPVTPQS